MMAWKRTVVVVAMAASLLVCNAAWADHVDMRIVRDDPAGREQSALRSAAPATQRPDTSRFVLQQHASNEILANHMHSVVCRR